MLLLGGMIACVLGCGRGDGLDRREVRGDATYDNEPIPEGTITLFPKAGGFVASGPIVNGQYVIKRASGPTPGLYQVKITGLRKTGNTIRIEEPGVETKEIEEVTSYIPTRYNDKSELELTVHADDSVIEVDFDLQK
jgi:hypothetical protein